MPGKYNKFLRLKKRKKKMIFLKQIAPFLGNKILQFEQRKGLGIMSVISIPMHNLPFGKKKKNEFR